MMRQADAERIARRMRRLGYADKAEQLLSANEDSRIAENNRRAAKMRNHKGLF